MNLKSKQLKRNSKTILIGKYSICVAGCLLTILFSLFVNDIISRALKNSITFYTLASLITLLLGDVLTCGLVKLFLNLCRDEAVSLSTLFFGFQNHPDHAILLSLFTTIVDIACLLPALLALWLLRNSENYFAVTALLALLLCLVSLTLVIFISFRFSLSRFFYLDHPETEVRELLKQSNHYMQGNLLRYFYLNLSFLGMFLLIILSYGIALPWVQSYWNTTLCEFYRNVIAEI